MAERMNPDVKAKWLTALRSGEYEQTIQALHRTAPHGSSWKAGWCCYGVLCDLASKDGVRVVRKTDEDREYFDGCTDYLPQSVWSWAGLSHGDPYVNGQSLATRNDSGVPFVDIASLIEEHL